MTLLSSQFDSDRFKRSNLQKKKKLGERESLFGKLFNSTLCWFSISLSLYLNSSKDGLKLGSSLQHFFIISYLKHKDVMNTSVVIGGLETVQPILDELAFFLLSFPFVRLVQ